MFWSVSWCFLRSRVESIISRPSSSGQIWTTGPAAGASHFHSLECNSQILSNNYLKHFLHQFLGLPWHRSMTKFVSDHMRKNKVENNPFHATSLNSSEKVDQWRSSLSQDELNNLLRSCGGVTDLYKNISMFWFLMWTKIWKRLGFYIWIMYCNT